MSDDHKKRHPIKLIQYANGPSLEEINGTVEVPHGKGFWRTLFAYSGPGALVAVGYMDPGNWSTSITGGQNFQYLLISVILMSSLIAMLLQYMAAKLGIVSQMDLAQAIRARTSKKLGIVLWILTELAIMATDIAEVIGAAIALYLLFHIPLVIAVLVTVLDVLVLLLLTKIGFRKIEAIVVALILVILLVFVYQVALSDPNMGALLKGFIPTGETFASSPSINGMSPIQGALGIIGATVMPHNLICTVPFRKRGKLITRTQMMWHRLLNSQHGILTFSCHSPLLLTACCWLWGSQSSRVVPLKIHHSSACSKLCQILQL